MWYIGSNLSNGRRKALSHFTNGKVRHDIHKCVSGWQATLSDFLNSSLVFHLCLHLLKNVLGFLLEHYHFVLCLCAILYHSRLLIQLWFLLGLIIRERLKRRKERKKVVAPWALHCSVFVPIHEIRKIHGCASFQCLRKMDNKKRINALFHLIHLIPLH